jgi:hypothetical protein
MIQAKREEGSAKAWRRDELIDRNDWNEADGSNSKP